MGPSLDSKFQKWLLYDTFRCFGNHFRGQMFKHIYTTIVDHVSNLHIYAYLSHEYMY